VRHDEGDRKTEAEETAGNDIWRSSDTLRPASEARGIKQELPRHHEGRGGGPLEGLKRATDGGPKTAVNRYFCEEYN